MHIFGKFGSGAVQQRMVAPELWCTPELWCAPDLKHYHFSHTWWCKVLRGIAWGPRVPGPQIKHFYMQVIVKVVIPAVQGSKVPRFYINDTL